MNMSEQAEYLEMKHTIKSLIELVDRKEVALQRAIDMGAKAEQERDYARSLFRVLLHSVYPWLAESEDEG